MLRDYAGLRLPDLVFFGDKESEPVAVDVHRGAVTGRPQAPLHQRPRESIEQRIATLQFRLRAKGLQGDRRDIVHIAVRQARVGVAFTTQVAADVAAILAQQRSRVVFWMALEEYKQTVALS